MNDGEVSKCLKNSDLGISVTNGRLVIRVFNGDEVLGEMFFTENARATKNILIEWINEVMDVIHKESKKGMISNDKN